VLQRVEYRESDLIIMLMTESLGRVTALARGAKRSSKRFGGALEPIHTLRVRLDERIGAELFTLREASIATPRRRITADLDRIQVAGRALAWLRKAAPHASSEPELWRAITELFDCLDSDESGRAPKLFLAEFGLRLLLALGFALDFERCVRCGKMAAPGQSAYIDPARGGIVCRACGGARLRLDPAARDRMRRAAEGQLDALVHGDAEPALDLVELSLRAHVGIT
jgi:DNA repair protein RecO (recombination protein O)